MAAEHSLIEAEARLQDEHEDSAWDEEEPERFARKLEKWADQQAIRLAEAEAQLREGEAQLQSGQEPHVKAEVEALGIVEESERFEISSCARKPRRPASRRRRLHNRGK